MNYFQLMAYSNIVICILLVILIVLIIVSLLKNDNEKISDEIYSTKRVLQDIYNKLDKNK